MNILGLRIITSGNLCMVTYIHLRQGLSLNVDLMGSTWLADLTLPPSLQGGSSDTPCSAQLIMDTRDLNSVPDASTESTLLTEPSAQPQCEASLPRMCNFHRLSTCALLCLDLRMCNLLASVYRKTREGWTFYAADGHKGCDQTHAWGKWGAHHRARRALPRVGGRRRELRYTVEPFIREGVTVSPVTWLWGRGKGVLIWCRP